MRHEIDTRYYPFGVFGAGDGFFVGYFPSRKEMWKHPLPIPVAAIVCRFLNTDYHATIKCQEDGPCPGFDITGEAMQKRVHTAANMAWLDGSISDNLYKSIKQQVA